MKPATPITIKYPSYRAFRDTYDRRSKYSPAYGACSSLNDRIVCKRCSAAFSPMYYTNVHATECASWVDE